jgi:predicted secreted protein
MGLVRGEDVILSAFNIVDGVSTLTPLACARSVTFDISTDFIETSVIESGAFKTFIPSGKQFSGNIEGLVFLDKFAGSEVRASLTWDFTSIPSESFPAVSTYSEIIVQDPAGYIDLCSLVNIPYLTKSDYIDAILLAINTSGTGYTAEFGAGSTMIIRAAPGLGDTINGVNCFFQNDIDGITFTNLIPFAGGSNEYTPDKLGIGWMYENIISAQRIQLRYYETDDDNHFLQKDCYVYIESINETSSFDNMVTFTAQFKGDGGITITYGEI